MTEQIELEVIRNGHIAVIRCEGVCSSAYTDDRPMWISRMRAAGYSPEDVTMMLTSAMVNQPHRHTTRVVDKKAREVRLGFSCMVCGHERVFGNEELQPESPRYTSDLPRLQPTRLDLGL